MNYFKGYCLRSWYQPPSLLTFILAPFSILYAMVVKLRRCCYRLGFMEIHNLPVPVIIVGNITVGGTGKSPLVAYLAQLLKGKGYKVGLISRGYGGKINCKSKVVTISSNPSEVGDEPLMLVQQTALPMVVGSDRVLAAKHLLKEFDCDLIISDDGLQHYALGRDLEIAVIDGIRRLGNGFYLPAGPLREGASRLKKVDCILVNGGEAKEGELPMRMEVHELYNLQDSTIQWSFPLKEPLTVHAVAGIGCPEHFFELLRKLGFHVIPHAYEDHYDFCISDIDFKDFPIIMTSKDAVKCRQFADARHWCLSVRPVLGDAFIERIEDFLARKKKSK